MRYFLDTEFIESGPHCPIQLVSIGIVSALGEEFYAVSGEFEYTSANNWVRDNVLSHLGDVPRLGLHEIAQRVREFIESSGLKNSDGSPSRFNGAPEFWGYYADYDWVVFSQLFGTMMDLPKGWPMYCRDLKQWCDSLGNPRLPAHDSKEHNALNDARWNQKVYNFLADLSVVNAGS